MKPADALKQRKARNREQLDGYVDALDARHPGYADNLVRQRNNLDTAEMLDELAIASVTLGMDAVTRKLDEDFAEMLAMLADDRADSRRMNEHKPHRYKAAAALEPEEIPERETEAVMGLR